MCNALDISKYVIFQYWKHGDLITNLKLQKILYYIQGYSLKRCNEVAFTEAIYRWPYGPVVPDVYFEYNSFRANTLSEPSESEMKTVFEKLSEDKATKSVVDDVIKKSYNFRATQLVEKTHSEDPWKSSKDSSIISPEIIKCYFINHDPLLVEASVQ